MTYHSEYIYIVCVCVCGINHHLLFPELATGGVKGEESIKFAYLRTIEALHCHFELCALCFVFYSACLVAEKEMFCIAVWSNPYVHFRLWIIWRKLWIFKAGFQLLMDTIPIQQQQTGSILWALLNNCMKAGVFSIVRVSLFLCVYIYIMFIYNDVMLFSWYCICRVPLLIHICILYVTFSKMYI